ncbi:MAG: isoprenylcysteine carboxylmethyltransferase family protein [Longimicrobiales bacterium]|nr:isoprenylcysteine carboxylmethyltransferase family protein [Longimicrobiales bacterium]
MRKAITLTTSVAVVLAVLVLVLTRRMGWSLGWVYVWLCVVALIINLFCLLRWNPVLIGRRMGFTKGTKSWDLVWLVLWTPVLIAVYAVAITESGWVSMTPDGAWVLGLLMFIAGWFLLTWSQVVNPFLEKTVRIQTDHGHRVIETGPYAYVRHPFYVGIVLYLFSAPLMLMSNWAFIPAILASVGLVIRTILEDRTLYRELPGYADYSTRVRARLIPGIW